MVASHTQEQVSKLHQEYIKSTVTIKFIGHEWLYAMEYPRLVFEFTNSFQGGRKSIVKNRIRSFVVLFHDEVLKSCVFDAWRKLKENNHFTHRQQIHSMQKSIL